MANKTHDRFQLERLAFFSDAVFAIAITLLVIEIKVPDVESEAQLWTALAQLIPQYVGFVVSFLVIGRFWTGHHRLFGLLARSDPGLVSRNLLLLMLVAFGPFPTAVFSDYTVTWTAVVLYTGWLATLGALNFLLIRYVEQAASLHDDGAQPVDFARLMRGAWGPIIIAALALAAGAIRPLFALAPLLLSPLIMAGLARMKTFAAKP